MSSATDSAPRGGIQLAEDEKEGIALADLKVRPAARSPTALSTALCQWSVSPPFSRTLPRATRAPPQIILLGDSAVGKSKLVERYLMDNYHPRQRSTYALTLYRHEEDVDEDAPEEAGGSGAGAGGGSSGSGSEGGGGGGGGGSSSSSGSGNGGSGSSGSGSGGSGEAAAGAAEGGRKRRRRVAVDFWDTAGQERFASMHASYYYRAHACVLVFDVTRKVTYTNLVAWYKELRQFCPHIPVLCIANKIDVDYAVTGKAFAFPDKHGLPFFFVSAADGTNVVAIFQEAVRLAWAYKTRGEKDFVEEVLELIDDVREGAAPLAFQAPRAPAHPHAPTPPPPSFHLTFWPAQKALGAFGKALYGPHSPKSSEDKDAAAGSAAKD